MNSIFAYLVICHNVQSKRDADFEIEMSHRRYFAKHTMLVALRNKWIHSGTETHREHNLYGTEAILVQLSNLPDVADIVDLGFL